MRRRGKPFKVCGVYDTETTNYGTGKNAHAFTVLYQINDIRNVMLADYEAGKSDDIRLYRNAEEVVDWLRDLATWGHENEVVPVVCAYNMLFDTQTIIYALACECIMDVCARSSTNAYTIDLWWGERRKQPDLRLWDTFYLDPVGLRDMGETAGLPKLIGDWNYDLVRTPETPLTSEEVKYASRDVQVIPAYLRTLLGSNEWMTEDMLGKSVLTKTSIVRQLAKYELFNRVNVNGKKLGPLFLGLCKANRPTDYWEYEIQKACNRAGLTFTAAANASVIMHNVASLDVTSMHHAWISAMIPKNFKRYDAEELGRICETITSASVKDVLLRYERPFEYAIHARVRFDNIRLREGSCFEKWGIATLAKAKFGRSAYGDGVSVSDPMSKGEDVRGAVQRNEDVKAGWHDSAVNPTYAFSKLYKADSCEVFLSEIELWVVSQVYAWDKMTVIEGEATRQWRCPPEYIVLQSHMLYEQKRKIKTMLKRYEYGKPYDGVGLDAIPQSMAEEARRGELDPAVLKAVYQNVKGNFNSIYGTQVQDVFKPDFMVEDDATFSIDESTITTNDNYEEHVKKPQSNMVYYAYGLRIAGRSRMHLILALELLAMSGIDFQPTGGDTDSIKLSVPEGVSDEQILEILEPLHRAVDRSIYRGTGWMVSDYPGIGSTLDGVGHFEVEGCDDEDKGITRYPLHFELWNKGRVSIDAHGHAHVTMAGLSRPAHLYTIETYIEDDAKIHGAEHALKCGLGYDSTVPESYAYSLQRTQPKPQNEFLARVVDYRGNACVVKRPEAICLYSASRTTGALDSSTNEENVVYLKETYGRECYCEPRELTACRGRIEIYNMANKEGYFDALRALE